MTSPGAKAPDGKAPGGKAPGAKAPGGKAPGGKAQGPLPPLLLVLTVVTGVVDAVSILRLGRVFVANMTGNVVFTGFALVGAPGFSLSASLAALAGFLAGALLGGSLTSRLGHDRGLLLRGRRGGRTGACVRRAGPDGRDRAGHGGGTGTATPPCWPWPWASRTRWPAASRCPTSPRPCSP